MPTYVNVPSEVTAGDSWSWTRELPDYPSPWALSYQFKNAESDFSASASVSGDTHTVSLSAATTSGLKPGRYRWFARVSNGGEAHTIEDGWLDVRPDPAIEGQYDYRTAARRTLDAIEATLLGRATSDQLAMSIAGRSLSRIPIPDLLQWRDKLRQEVRNEEAGERAGLGRDIKVRLRRA